MGIKSSFFLLVSILVFAGCASTAPTSDDAIQFMASDKAMQILDEQGKAEAAMLSNADLARDTELICERFYKTGSHITTSFCYTRAEMERRRLNHQEEYRYMTKGGPCLPPRPGGGNPGMTRAVGCGGG